MAAPSFLLFLLFTSFTIHFASSATPPASSPSPTADLPADSIPSPASSQSPSTASPVSPPSDSPISSPPAPPPSDLASPPPAAPSPANPEVPPPSPSPSPSPSPAPADLMSDDKHSDNAGAGVVFDEDDGSSGLSGGKKAGIAVGVIAAVAVVGVGALVYKKRQDNIRRSQYGYAARRELL